MSGPRRLPRRPIRSTRRGQAVVFVAVGMLTMLAVVGVALDGGLEAGNYRAAQNAADSAALAAARYIYTQEMAGTTPTYAQVQSVVDKYTHENNATSGAVSLDTGSGRATLAGAQVATTRGGRSLGLQLAALAGCTPYCITSSSSQAALAQITVPVTNVNDTASTSQAQTGMSGGSATASGIVEVAYVNVPPALAVNAFCVQSDQAHIQAACTGSTSPVTYGTLGSQFTVSAVSPTTGQPSVINQQTTMNAASGSVPGTTLAVSSSSATEVNSINPAGQITSTVSGTTVSVAVTATVSISIAQLTYTVGLQLSAGSGGSPPAVVGVAPQCSPGSVVISVLGVATTVPVAPDCTMALPAALVSSLAAQGVTLTVPTTTAPSCSGLSCSVSGCFLGVALTPAIGAVSNACVGQVQASATISGPASTCTAPTCLFTATKVTVVASVATPTYFVRILGIIQTTPTATATAEVLPVTDVSDAQLTNSSYAVPDVGQEQDAPNQYVSLLSDAAIGHVFYMYGPISSYYEPVLGAPALWNGRISSSGAHSVGSTVSFLTGVRPGVTPFLGATIYVQPVISGTGVIEAYALFKTDAGTAGDTRWGRLVDSVPASGGNLIQAQANPAVSTWYPGAAGGALTVRLTH